MDVNAIRIKKAEAGASVLMLDTLDLGRNGTIYSNLRFTPTV